ncbi:DUF882 domain-containing protein [Neptuniibacter halophilus]|uniref:DUF882 domain-containing protein n=1 Tax=Neptuniibacter halophilus TaxID=651666 RepID=UPI0025722659|nr:DUF882 domain-containing protein [Neptuniibacter halophilus]
MNDLLQPEPQVCHTRRKLIKAIGGFSALSTIPVTAQGKVHSVKDQALNLINLHTGESIHSTFFSEGQFQRSSLKELDHLLRDHRNGQIHKMDTALLSLLGDLQLQFGAEKPIHVISAYRSPETNAMLSQKSSKVAKKSYHMRGMAIDIRIPGVELKDLHHAALKAKAGGVGLYTRSNFVHLDVGRVRRWGA